MQKVLFALLAMSAACADNTATPGNDNGTDTGGGDNGSDGSGGGGGDVSTADRMQDYDDVAASVGGHLAISDLSAMIDAVNLSFGRTPTGFTATAGSDFTALEGTRGGLTIEYKVYCRDDADAYTQCNGLENHAHIKPTYTGDASDSAMSVSAVDRKAAWIVRELQQPTVRIGGDGTEAFSTQLGNSDYSFTITDTVDHVLFAPTPTMPVAGAIELVVQVERTRASASPATRSFSVNAKVDFPGGDLATITLDDVEHYNVTLSTGAVVRI
jgi:hypothetical protein